MKKVAALIACLVTCAASGQENTPEMHRLLIGVQASADICYRTLESLNASPISHTIINLRDENESPKFSQSFGLSICYNLTRHWSAESGLLYSNQGFQQVITDIFYGAQIDPRYGFVYNSQESGPAPKKIRLIDNFNYLDIPLRIVYRAGKGRVGFVSGIGITTNILIRATSTAVIKYGNGETDRIIEEQPFDYETLNLSPSVSLGVDWQCSKRFNLRAEPMFRYGLLKIIDAPVTAHLWSGGLNFSCYYALK